MDRQSRTEKEAAEARASDLRALLERELRNRLIVPTEVRLPHQMVRNEAPEPLRNPVARTSRVSRGS